MKFWARLTSAAGLFAIAAMALAASPLAAPRIEKKIEKAANGALRSAGVDGASARASGRAVTIHLSGANPQEVGGIAARVQAIKGVSRVFAVETAPPPIEPPFELPPIETRQDRETLASNERPGDGAMAPTPAPPEPEKMDAEKTEAEKIAPLETAPPQPTPADIAALCQSAINRTMNGRRIIFDQNSSNLGAGDNALLDALAVAMNACAGQTIIVEGHTDAIGSAAANLRLSQLRAERVAAALKQHGARVELTVKAAGEARPIAPNATPAGRANNRRIDFAVAPGAAEAASESE